MHTVGKSAGPQAVITIGHAVCHCGQTVRCIGQNVALPEPLGQTVSTGSMLHTVTFLLHTVTALGQFVRSSGHIVAPPGTGHCVRMAESVHIVATNGHLVSPNGHSVNTSGQVVSIRGHIVAGIATSATHIVK